MKCQILFSRNNKKNINLSSAELTQRVVKVRINFKGNEHTYKGNNSDMETLPPF